MGWLTFSLKISPALDPKQVRDRPFVNHPEGCYLADPVEPENVNSYLRVQIQALSLAESGERNRRLKTAEIASVGAALLKENWERKTGFPTCRLLSLPTPVACNRQERCRRVP